MGKLKLSDIDKTYIHNFLNYSDKKMEKDWVDIAAIINMCLFYSSVLLADKKILCGIVFTIINALLVFILIHYNRKVEHNQGNLHFYFGIYMCVLPISLSVPECLMLRMYVGEYIYAIMIAQYCLIVLVALITIRLLKRRICNNHYKYKPLWTPYVAFASVGVLTSMTILDDIDLYLVLGVCFAFLSILFGVFPTCFIKSYCYYLTKKK